MKILICGFMGAGKSHWLVDLIKKSDASECVFLDLDHVIAQSIKVPHSQLGKWIADHGWPSFRKMEQEKIGEFLNGGADGVLCLGGGSLNQGLIELVHKNENIKLVFLDTPFDLCYERITGDHKRPLASLKKEELRKLYEERMPLYREAHLILREEERKGIVGIRALVHTLNGLK